MGLVMDISDRVCVVNVGRKIAEGPPAEVSADPLWWKPISVRGGRHEGRRSRG